MVEENLKRVLGRIEAACRRAGRSPAEVTLIAVSKTKPVSMIREAMECGIVNFGENKVQELVEKQEEIKETLSWHMIGHLQRNKVKYVVDRVCLIHSVDSLRLAEQIEEEAAKKGVVCPILLEVNVSGEETKFGVPAEQALLLAKNAALMPHLQVRGLMTIAPHVENPEENRVYFQKLKKLCVDIKRENIDNVTMDVLSMGMTNDFEIAIEEGATMVRVGTGIFGERNYSI